MLKKLVIHTALLAGLLALAFTAMHFVTAPVQAQSSGAFTSLTPLYAPAAINATATCATTACPTFTMNGICTATVRVTGTNSAIVVTVKASNDAGANYSQITPLVVGVAANGTVTTNNIALNGLYSLTLPTMNRVRFEIGTLTGTNVNFKLVASGACASQAL